MKEKPQEFEQFIEEKVKTQEPIGKGSEKVVYPHPDKPDKVIGVYHHGNYPREYKEYKDQYVRRAAKAEFYLIKILHMLFPNNFADISMATTEPRTTTREKVITKRKWLGLREDEASSGDIEKIVQDMVKLGIFVDSYNKNFIKNKQGHAVYVDGFDSGGLGVSVRKLRDTIVEKLNGSDQERALKYLDRLDDLIHNF